MSNKILSWQVLLAAEGALRRLQVSGAERNAILDTFRYVDGISAQRSAAADADAAGRDAAAAEALARQQSAPASTSEKTESKPFTRCRAHCASLCRPLPSRQLVLSILLILHRASDAHALGEFGTHGMFRPS